MILNEYIDTLISARRYEIVNESSINNKIKYIFDQIKIVDHTSEKILSNKNIKDRIDKEINHILSKYLYFDYLLKIAKNKTHNARDEKYKNAEITAADLVSSIKIVKTSLDNFSDAYDRGEDCFILSIYFVFTKYCTNQTTDQNLILQTRIYELRNNSLHFDSTTMETT